MTEVCNYLLCILPLCAPALSDVFHLGRQLLLSAPVQLSDSSVQPLVRTLPGKRMKEGNVLFNDALNAFYLRLYGVRHMVKNHSDREKGAWVLLYASSHRQDNTYHRLCYTSCGALAGMRSSPMGPPWRIDTTTHRSMSERSYHRATSRS